MVKAPKPNIKKAKELPKKAGYTKDNPLVLSLLQHRKQNLYSPNSPTPTKKSWSYSKT